VSTIIGLRDRALIALLIYSFARISAALEMDVEDYYPQGKRWWVRLHEKGGKQHEMPAHHLLEQYLDAYVTAAGPRRRQKYAAISHARRPRPQAAHHRWHDAARTRGA
jgi:integrase